MTVIKATRFGRTVSFDPIMDEARRHGCLCQASATGRRCKRLENNLRGQRDLLKHFSEKQVEHILLQNGVAALGRVVGAKKQGRDIFAELSPLTPCPVAEANYAICVGGGIATATSFCSGYISPDDEKKE